MTRHHLTTDDGREITPADLTPNHPDHVIFDVMTTRPEHPHVAPLVTSRTNPETGRLQAWSRTQDRWLNVAEYADEWRHRYRYRQVMGNEDEARAVSDYERTLGL